VQARRRRKAHPHRQVQCPLCRDRGVHGGLRWGDRGNYTVARVAEQIGVVPLYRGAQYLVVRHPAKTKARAIRQLESLGYKVNLESLADTAWTTNRDNASRR
jgi:hypothetical protein